MLVPDQSHINRVRDALWQRFGGGASVMIGSGFSRSALKIRPDAQDPPLWRDVIEKMSDKLYPPKVGGAPSTDGYLRTAQEYETAFGRSDLHRFIRQTVRDDDFKPGEVHTRLLRLPWRDVFTTNWDTLLERTRVSVPERAYSVVTNMDEIPLASRPRIVKLHGSLPAQFPLIFTEEDYRTYPTKFAPFVNTVQQAMMETVFCLIGFSGDDPNFLQWSGWVRDNLGDAAPKIYLAGWLNLSPHRRRMLEDRNVVPVDLAHHPKAATWPEHLRHYHATDWLLHTLERGRPYDVTSWPSPNAQDDKAIPTHLEPVEVVISDMPKQESLPASSPSEPETDSVSVQALCEAWAHNRKIYPGWLVAPNSVQTQLSRKTREWEPCILRALPDLEPVERLNAVRELVWRRELLLEPISPDLETASGEILKLIDCQSRTIGGVADPIIEWAAVREAWRSVALALVTVARHRFDRDVFDQRIEALSPYLRDDPDIDHRIRHERCLWAMYAIDFETLDGSLKDWQTENCDPAWMMRKAALLFETGEHDEAVALVRDALAAIRAMPTDDSSLAGPSREGWALWLVLGFENYRNSQMIFKRWRELASLKCDALVEKEHIADAIKAKRETRDAPSFDLGMRRGVRWTFSNENPQKSPYRAIRLSEVAGLPPSVGQPFGMNIAGDVLELAAENLSTLAPEMAVRLVLRVCTYEQDETLMRVLSRARVATLPADSARTLTEICEGVIEYVLPQMVGAGARPVFWIERMRVAMEVLSRLVLRLESDKVETIFDKALELYRNHQVAEDPWMTAPVRHLLQRCWEALPEGRRNDRTLDLLRAPIVGLDGFKANSDNYPDLGELLSDALPVAVRTRDNEGSWQEIVSLLVRGLQAGSEARKRAAVRATSVARHQLTAVEWSQIAQALWSERYVGLNSLPAATGLFDWVFFLLPDPESSATEQRFRDKWLTPNPTSDEDALSPHDILWEVGGAIAGLKLHQSPLALSEGEQSYLTEVIKQWLDMPIPSDVFPPYERQIREPIFRAIDGLRSILTEIQVPESVGEKLHEKAQALNESDMPGFVLMAGLVKALPNRLAELALWMRTGLASENEDIARDAVTGLHDWARASVKAGSQVQPPPDDLIREVGIIIATRRKASLAPSLQVAKWVFDEGNNAQKEAIRDLALQGLGYLSEELRYDRKDHDPDEDVPVLRWRSARLALSMTAHGFQDAPAVARWLEIVENDPLPEVRHAKRPAVTREAC